MPNKIRHENADKEEKSQRRPKTHDFLNFFFFFFKKKNSEQAHLTPTPSCHSDKAQIMQPMAGHSHGANIAHKKALVDAKRGKLWSRSPRGSLLRPRRGGDPNRNFASAMRSSTPKPAACRKRISSAPSSGGPANSRAATRRKWCTRATARAAWPYLRNPDRQSQSHGRRSAQDLRNRRRQARRHGLRRLDVRPQGPDLDSGRASRGRHADGAALEAAPTTSAQGSNSRSRAILIRSKVFATRSIRRASRQKPADHADSEGHGRARRRNGRNVLKLMEALDDHDDVQKSRGELQYSRRSDGGDRVRRS